MKINTKQLIRNYLRSKTLSKWDIEFLIELLNAGFTLVQSLSFIENKKNSHIIQSIKKELSNGESIQTVMIPYLFNGMNQKFSCFIQFESFNKSLSLAYDLYDMEEKRKQSLYKNLLYPILILYITVVGLYIFNLMIYPKLIEMMSGFNVDNGMLDSFQKLLSMFSVLSLIVCIFLLIIVLIYMNKKYRVVCYRWIEKIVKNNLLKLSFSLRFAKYYLMCHKHGLSTKSTLYAMKMTNDDPLINEIGKEYDEKLLNGSSFETVINESFLDDLLIQFMKLSMLTAKTNELLEKYITINELVWQRNIRKLTISIQLSAYSIIGVILIFIYQILFVPMQVISSL